MLPQLRRLEQKYRAEISVVGVHSGKFSAERDTASIRDASLRLDAVHPTINDRQFRMWRAYAVRAWPTLVVVSPRGYVVGMHAGEFEAELIAPFLDRVLDDARASGTLDVRQVVFPADAPSSTSDVLAFPGKVAADGNRVAIADSGHHKVIIGTVDPATARMRIDRIVGTGTMGFRDGDQPLFNNPQGLAFHEEVLFVADAGNHALRAIDLSTGNARTIAGTGAQARTAADAVAGVMNSPWDVAHDAGRLYVAMAGAHQLWCVDVDTGASVVHSGSGAEELHDGTHVEAALAQPMGLCLAVDAIYFADSESSAIRIADRDRNGGVRTIVGTGLFDFGDVDAVGDAARLQHPQGLACALDGRLLVADSYNGSLKWVEPRSGRVRTWLRGLHEPSGVAIARERAFVAETHRHRIMVASLESGDVAELRLE